MMLTQAYTGVWEGRWTVGSSGRTAHVSVSKQPEKQKGGRHTMGYHSETDTHASEPYEQNIYVTSFLPGAKWMSKILSYKNTCVL